MAPGQGADVDSDVVLMGGLAAIMAVTTLLSWRQKDERRDVMLLGATAAGLSAGTALAWVF